MKTYKQQRTELDELLAWFDQDDMDVEEALVKYKQAIKLAKDLQEYLQKAENSITKLT